MKSDVFDSARQRAAELLDSWDQLYQELGNSEDPKGNRFDLEKPIPGLGLTIEDIKIQLNIAAGGVQEIRAADSSELLAAPPCSRSALESSLQKSSSEITAMLTELQRGLRSFNPENFEGSIAHPQNSQQNVPAKFSEKFKSIARHLDDAYNRLFQIKQLLPSSDDGQMFSGLLTSVARQAVCNLLSFARPRFTFSRISLALAVQMKGFGVLLC